MPNLQKTSLKNLKAISLSTFVKLTLLLLINSQFVNSLEAKQDDVFLTQPFVKCWSFETNHNTNFNIASDNKADLYLPLLNRKLISISARNGHKHWETDLGGETISPPLVESSNVYIAVNQEMVSNGKLERHKIVIRSLDKLTGVTNWESEIAETAVNEIEPNVIFYLYTNNISLVLISSKGLVIELEKSNGRILSVGKDDLLISTIPFFSGDKVIFSASDKIFFTDFPLTSMSIFKSKTEYIRLSSPTTAISHSKDLTEHTISWGDKKGFINTINMNSGKQIWKYRIGAEVSNIVQTSVGLFVTSYDNFTYMLSEKTGELLWKKRLNGRIIARPFISGKYAVVTAIADTSATVIDLTSGKTVNKIILENDNFFIGEGTRIENLLFYSTVKGIYAFSHKDFCRE